MTNDHIESDLQQRLRQTESQIDATTQHRLREMREAAVARQNRWFDEYRRPVLAGMFGLLLTAALINSSKPFYDQPQEYAVPGDPIEALMEDPSFYIWLNESGRLVADR